MAAQAHASTRKLVLVALSILLACVVMYYAAKRTRMESDTHRAPVDTGSVSTPIRGGDAVDAMADPSTAKGSTSRTPIESSSADEAGEQVTITVTTRDGSRPDAPVPHIGFELVRSDPIAQEMRVIATGRTDGAGEAHVTVPRLTIIPAEAWVRPRFWARVVEPGYQHRKNELSLSEPVPTGNIELVPEEIARVRLLAWKGYTLSGRVVDEANRAVRAHVGSWSRRAIGWERHSGVETSADGSFELHEYVDRPLTLLAEAEERGSGVLENVPVPPAMDAAPLIIVVHAPGVVRGRVIDETGVPAAGVELLVVQAELEDERGSFILSEPRATELQMQGRGRTWATLTTAGDGTFEATGLRADRFSVRARTSVTAHYPFRLTEAPVLADGASLALRLSRPHVVVRIVYPDGKPWAGAIQSESGARRAPVAEEYSTRLDVCVARDSAHVLDTFESVVVPVRELGAASFAFDGVPGRTYTIALQGDGVAFTAQDVHLDENAGRIDAVIVARGASRPGTLRMRLPGVGSEMFAGEIAFRLEDVTTGFPVFQGSDSTPVPSWVTRTVPAGTYTLVVEGRPRIEGYHGTLWASRALGGVVTTVVIREGETTSIEPVLGAGARLTLLVSGSLDQADRDALTRTDPTMTAWNVDEWASFVEVQLLAPKRWPSPVYFRLQLAGSSSAGPLLRSELPFGTEQTSELLASGTYRLEARTRGGRVATVPVVLVDGQTTSVRLEIPAK